MKRLETIRLFPILLRFPNTLPPKPPPILADVIYGNARFPSHHPPHHPHRPRRLHRLGSHHPRHQRRTIEKFLPPQPARPSSRSRPKADFTCSTSIFSLPHTPSPTPPARESLTIIFPAKAKCLPSCNPAASRSALPPRTKPASSPACSPTTHPSKP